MSDPHIRLATTSDLPAINAIYNHYVVHSTATYDVDPMSEQTRANWFIEHGPGYPVTVAQVGEKIVGWGSLSQFRPRIAYQPTVENSVYLHPDHLFAGIGRAVLRDLVHRATNLGYHSIIAGISADQTPSVRLHARFGFTVVAQMKEVGRKFDRWLDVVYMQKMLA